MLDKLKQVEDRYEELCARAEQPDFYADPKKAAAWLREQKELAPIVAPYRAYCAAQRDMQDAAELMAGQADAELKALCQEELTGAKKRAAALEQEPPPENEAALERLYCRILRFVADRAELCGILFGPNGDRSLLQRLEVQVLAYCGICREAGLDTVERFLATFLVSGFINVVEQWLSEGMKLPPEQLAASIMRATREGFSLGLCPLVRNLADPLRA